MIRYEVIIYWSEEDEVFIAEVPELAGCMADGSSYQEALTNVEVVIQEWIETAQELGRPIPEPKGRLIYACSYVSTSPRLVGRNMEFTASGIPHSLQFAFQEYDLEKLHPDEHAFTVIERTLAYGNRAELRWLFAQYGSERLAAWVSEAGWRVLPRYRLIFWVSYFDLSNLPQRRGVWPY